MVRPPEFMEISITDISTGGMGFYCDAPLREKDILNFAVAVPAGIGQKGFDVAQCQARVMSSFLSGGRFRIGVQFISLLGQAETLFGKWTRGVPQLNIRRT